MAYITQSLVQQRIGETELIRLTDDAVAGAVGTDNLARAIAEGEGEILNNLGQRYVLPLGLSNLSTSAAVFAKLLDAVLYRLHARRPPVPEDVSLDYDRAIKWSRSIAKGEIGLLDETLLGESPAGQGKMIIDGSSRVITRDSMSGL